MELGRRRLVVLANSFKHGGRCIAGIDLESSEWIRPVTALDSGALSAKQTEVLANGERRPLRPLDVAGVDLGPRCSTPHHPEDVRWSGTGWAYGGTGDVSRLIKRFADLFEPGPEILGNKSTRLVPDDFEKEGHRSLALVYVKQPRFEVRENKVRCRFDLAGCSYDLSTTDVDFCRRWTAQPFAVAAAVLTISLAVPWQAPDGVMSCYKLAAGVMEVVPG